MQGLTQTLPGSSYCTFNQDHAEETRYLYHCTPKSSKRDPVSLTPNSDIPHKETAFLPTLAEWQHPFTYPLHPQQACPASSLHCSGQEFATALSGPCPYKEVGAAAWDWGHPSLPLLTPLVRRRGHSPLSEGTATKKYPQQNPLFTK